MAPVPRPVPTRITEDDPVIQAELDEIATRQLACAVIHQAVKDAAVQRGIDTYTARMFLHGGEGLREWCELAGLRYDIVTEYAARTFPREEPICQNP